MDENHVTHEMGCKNDKSNSKAHKSGKKAYRQDTDHNSTKKGKVVEYKSTNVHVCPDFEGTFLLRLSAR